MARLTTAQRTSLTILVAALGYFVDVFDLQLFGIVRISSLKSLGITGDEMTSYGALLLNAQMGGMLLGGVLWGILGDRKGRVYVLFGTILLYSLGNIANAFVTTIPEYALARFATGFGLAGEIGAGITLATELLPKSTRGYAATVIVTCGVMGPLVASFLADAVDWRYAYAGGGALGLLLLALRVSINESTMFASLNKQPNVARGRFLMLFRNRQRFSKYICSILIGVPDWFVLGILAIFSPEIGKALGVTETLKAATAVTSCFVGLTIGSFLSGLLSQLFRSRRKVLACFLIAAGITSSIILTAQGISANTFYGLLLLNGIFIGYWTLFLTTTAEQFGTNLRATATTTVPNFVRGSVILNTSLITLLKPEHGLLASVQIDGALCLILALLALWKLPETFGKDLDYVER